jgi:hypothetical protein
MNTRGLASVIMTVGVIVAVTTLVYDGPVAAQSVPDVIRVRALELVDERGRVRAQLDVEASGEVVLRLRDSTGTIRVKLGAGHDGSGLLLANERTEPGVHILANQRATSITLQRGAQRHVITSAR